MLSLMSPSVEFQNVSQSQDDFLQSLRVVIFFLFWQIVSHWVACHKHIKYVGPLLPVASSCERVFSRFFIQLLKKANGTPSHSFWFLCPF